MFTCQLTSRAARSAACESAERRFSPVKARSTYRKEKAMRRSSVATTLSVLSVLSAFTVFSALSASVAAGQSAPAKTSKLLTPAALTAKAPAAFTVKFDTTKGLIVLEVHRDWSPFGADRFYNLVNNGFFTGARFFRVIPGFMAQFGINGNPAVNAAWDKVVLKDDPAGKQSNTRGTISY